MKKLSVMFAIILIFLITYIQISFANNLPIIKILLIQSYNINDIAGEAQLAGFKDKLQQYKNIYSFKVQSFYMQSRTVNKTKEEKQQVSRYIINNLIKTFKPNVVVTFGDPAFTYVGLKLPVTLPWIFCGNTKQFSMYLTNPILKTRLKLNDIFGVQGTIQITNDFLNILKGGHKIIILYDNTKTSRFLMNDIYYQLKHDKIHNVQIETKYISDSTYLEEYLFNNDNITKSRIIYIITLQNLYDSQSNKFLDIIKIDKIFNRYNYHNIEVGLDLSSIKYLSITIGHNYKQMGEFTMKHLIEILNKQHSSIITTTMYIYLSVSNLQRIGLGNTVLLKYIKEIDEIKS